MAGFRGATSPVELRFDVSKSVTLIFGENGTGKSTVADAFDFICNRSYGSLGGYSLGGPDRKYVAALGAKPSDVNVSLVSASKTWTASLGKDGPLVSPSTGCPDARILRRRQILRLIETQPKQRFDALREFLSVPNIEKSETSLREATRNTEGLLNEAVRALEQAGSELEKLWTAEGKPGSGASDWAAAEARKDVAAMEASVKHLGALEFELQRVESALGGLDRAFVERKATEELLKTVEAKQKAAESRLSQQDAELLKLLQDSKTYVEKKTPLSRCPVCEQSVESGALLNRLSERINGMKELASLVTATQAAKRQVDAKTPVAEQAGKDFCQKAQALTLCLKSSSAPEIGSLGLDWSKFGDLISYEELSDVVEQQARQIWSAASRCRNALQTRKNLEQKSINQHNAIKGHVETQRDKTTKAAAYEKQFKKLSKALEIVSRERKDYVDGVLAKIAKEVENLYAKLHPGEGIGKVRFYLKPNAIGSLEFDAQFQSANEVPPQAYYSESHLDTLGICVFLALGKHFKTENTIVILDDVLTSVDGPHLDRFMKLIHDEAQLFNQMILTTHYRPWRERYRWAKGPAASTQMIELGPWTLSAGLQAADFFSAVDDLKLASGKTPFDRQAAASKAGIVLESLLDFITLKYRSPIPRNVRNEYTLGDLGNAIDLKLAKELRTRKSSKNGSAKLETLLKPILDATTAHQWIRNSVGCHFNTLGNEVSDAEVRQFCQSVLNLASHLICPSCVTLPTRRPSGSHWQCGCGEMELFPLIYPGSDPRTVDDEA